MTGRPLFARLREEIRFLKNLADQPMMLGAVAPSSRSLARAMADHVDTGRPGEILELGPGLGAVTEALIGRGLSPARITAIEYSPGFVTVLRRRFPGVNFVCGDAYGMVGRGSLGDAAGVKAVKRSAPGRRISGAPGPGCMTHETVDGFLAAGSYAAIVSSLPLLIKSPEERQDLLLGALDRLQPGAPFIQFSYGLKAPVRVHDKDVRLERGPWIVSNLPPARVWVYRRPVSRARDA